MNNIQIASLSFSLAITLISITDCKHIESSIGGAVIHSAIVNSHSTGHDGIQAYLDSNANKAFSVKIANYIIEWLPKLARILKDAPAPVDANKSIEASSKEIASNYSSIDPVSLNAATLLIEINYESWYNKSFKAIGELDSFFLGIIDGSREWLIKNKK